MLKRKELKNLKNHGRYPYKEEISGRQISLGVLGKYTIHLSFKLKVVGIMLLLSMIGIGIVMAWMIVQSASSPDNSNSMSFYNEETGEYSSNIISHSSSSFPCSPTGYEPSSLLSQFSEPLSKPDVEYIPIGIEKSRSPEILQATLDLFEGRMEDLKASLAGSGFYYTEKILDESIRTSAFILAKNEQYAMNLNGYFYYLFDRSLSSEMVSPVILNLAVLFDEESRETVFADGTFAQEGQSQALKSSLKALLGIDYSDEIFDFIIEGYKETFQNRVDDHTAKASLYKLRSGSLEVWFHDSFLTYIEFYLIEE